MKLRILLTVLSIFTAARCSFSEEVLRPAPRSFTEEEHLLERLFDGYNPSARPVLNSSHTVQVTVHFSLLQIQELNLKSQVFTTTGLLILEWMDERLMWNQTKFHMSDVVVEARKLWRPEFAAINGANDIYGDYGQFRAIIAHTGHVHWEPGGVFRTICEIDITYYPFDEQRCHIVFGAWSYHTAKMNLSNMADTVNLDSFELNGEWEIYKTLAVRNELPVFGGGDGALVLEEDGMSQLGTARKMFANVEFHIYIRRRYTFYVLNVILPSIMTSILLLSVFFSTPAQKVQIGVVVLLSFRIFLLNVTDSIPKTSDHIPLLGVYLACTMAITTLSMVLTVYVLNLYGISDRPVPPWAARLVTVHMARLVGMRRPSKLSSCHHASADVKTDFRHRRSNSNTNENVRPVNPLFSYTGGTNRTSTSNGRLSVDDSVPIERDLVVTFDSETRRNASHATETTALRRTGECDSSPVVGNPATWAKDWQRMAEIVDRLFFWVFLFAVVITTLLLFHPLARSYEVSLSGENIENAEPNRN